MSNEYFDGNVDDNVYISDKFKNIVELLHGRYYRDYKDYLILRRCCKKSLLELKKLDNSTLGRYRCCNNNNLKYYDNYGDFLRAKNCCSKLIVMDAYKKLIH